MRQLIWLTLHWLSGKLSCLQLAVYRVSSELYCTDLHVHVVSLWNSDIQLPSLDLTHGEEGRDRLSPSITLPPLVRTEAAIPPLKKEQSAFFLPPIDATTTQSLVAAKPELSEQDRDCRPSDERASHNIVNKKSDTTLIVEAAKKARQNLISGITSPKKVLAKMTSFTTPRMSVSRNSTSKSKYVFVPPSQTSVIDLEGGGAASSNSHSNSTACGKSCSHPHLNNTPSKESPIRARHSGKPGGCNLSLNKPFLSEASLRRVREGRTIVTIEELEKLTRRTGKSSSTHNTPLHLKAQHNINGRSPHHNPTGHSSTSLSKVAIGLSPSRHVHRDSRIRSQASVSKYKRTAVVATVQPARGGRQVTVRRALPQPPPLRRRNSPLPRKQLLPAKGRLTTLHDE